jgi:[ribosomal protein S18]-alanine N-acetyltransferase
MPFTLRDAKPKDFDALWRIDQQCFAPGIAYSRQELTIYMRRRGAFTLIANQTVDRRDKNEDKDQHEEKKDGHNHDAIAGFLVAHSGAIGHIITIDVVESFRRSGVGSLMLRAAEERLRENGSRAVGLETAVDNLSALAFYKRLGYHVIKTWPRYYATGVDALVLKKEL